MPYDPTTNPNYQQMIQRLQQSLPGTTQGNIDNYTNQIGGDTNQFMSQFKNYVGRDPNSDEINQFYSNFVIPNTDQLRTPGSQIQSNVPNAIQQFLGQNFQQQAQQQAQTQSQNALQGNLQTIQDVVNKQTQATAGNLLDPNSPTFQQFSGLMNNMGITPSSGAFQAGLGGTIGQAGAQNEAAALGQFAIPALGGQQGLATSAYGNALGNIYPGQQQYNQQSYDLQNFGLESQLARQLSEMGNPSTAQSILGMASGAANGAGGLMEGGAALSKSTSYVCKELIKRGYLCELDMDNFHAHIMPAMTKKGRAFWKYAMDGWRLVQAGNACGVDWKSFKPLLFDRVMSEPDACKAIDLYADACRQICMISDPSLWDPRVYRTGLWDSLPFLPRLFLYKPFLEALWKCWRIKYAIVYDMPPCEVHK